MTLILGAVAVVAMCCVFVDHSASWVERLGAVAGSLAMLDGVQPRGAAVAAVAWVAVLVVLALASGARLRFAPVSRSGRLIALHRALGLLALASALGAEPRSTTTHDMTMSDSADLGTIVMTVAYLASGVIMIVMSIRDRRSHPDRLDSFRGVRVIEAGFMTAMVIAMVTLSAPA